jgi:hypothetical protein
MGEGCNVLKRNEKCTQNLSERNHFGDPEVEGAAVIKWTLVKWGMKM